MPSIAVKAPLGRICPGTRRRQRPGRRLPLRLGAWITAGAVLVLSAGWPVKADGVRSDPRAFIQNFGNEGVAMIKDRESSPEQRKKHMRRLLAQRFDLDTIARLSLGRYWRKATRAQRGEYTRLFSRLVLETYTLRLEKLREAIFVRHGDQTDRIFESLKVRIKGIQPMDDRDSLVVTEIRVLDWPPHQIAYRVRSRNGDLRIVNVIEAGVNMIFTRRAEFASYVRGHGVDGLLALLEARHGKSEPDWAVSGQTGDDRRGQPPSLAWAASSEERQ
ncbi:MAG: phospholipid-binding protein MlaC [Rhodospirillales bacterium]